MDITQSLQWRYACKKFDPTQKLSENELAPLIESLRLAPSSYGLQPYKFLVISNPEIKAKLKEASFGQSQIVDCSHLVVFCNLKEITTDYLQNYVDQINRDRGIGADKAQAFFNVMKGDLIDGPRAKVIKSWAQRQAYIAMGMLLETAALTRIDSCPMEGLSAGQYDQILGLNDSSYGTVAVVALGKRSSEDGYQKLAKVRKAQSEIIQFIS